MESLAVNALSDNVAALFEVLVNNIKHAQVSLIFTSTVDIPTHITRSQGSHVSYY